LEKLLFAPLIRATSVPEGENTPPVLRQSAERLPLSAAQSEVEY
jgi:hypothetical protein